MPDLYEFYETTEQQQPTNGTDILPIHFQDNKNPKLLDAACAGACLAHPECNYAVRMGASCYLKAGQRVDMTNPDANIHTVVPNEFLVRRWKEDM